MFQKIMIILNHQTKISTILNRRKKLIQEINDQEIDKILYIKI